MSDITPVEIPAQPQTFNELVGAIRSAKEFKIGPETSIEAPILTKMAQIACNYLEHQPKLTEQEVKEIHSSLIKSCVQEINELLQEKPFSEAAKELRGIATRFALLVCLPIAYKNLGQIPERSSFVDTLLFFASLEKRSKQPEPPPKVKQFISKYNSDPKVREKYETFKNEVIGLRDSWLQGVLGEAIFFRLAQKAGLNPQFSTPKEDAGNKHIDYHITYKNKQIPVQIKSCQEGNTIPTVKKDQNGRLLIIVKVSTNWLAPEKIETLRQALIPSEETAQTFLALVKQQLYQYHNPAYSKINNR